MDSRDIIIIALVGVGGWLAWRYYQGLPTTHAAQTSPDTVDGAAASGMTESAARSTVFGGKTFLSRLLAPIAVRKDLLAGTQPTAPASSVPLPGIDRSVLMAAFRPVVNAPSPNNLRWTDVGARSTRGTAPAGDQPGGGSPLPFYVFPVRGIG